MYCCEFGLSAVLATETGRPEDGERARELAALPTVWAFLTKLAGGG